MQRNSIEILSFRKGITGLVGSLVALEQSSQIDQILSALESVHYLWLREADWYRRQRASLELGQLTEKIVPPKELLLIPRCKISSNSLEICPVGTTIIRQIKLFPSL